MKKIESKFLIVIINIFFIGIFMYFNNLNNTQNIANYDMELFNKVTAGIKDSFKVNQYEQIVKGNDVLGIPNFVPKEDVLDFYNRQAHYIYKNNDLNTIILLSITANNQQVDKTIWRHSICYSPDLHNSNKGSYAESYNPNLTSAGVYSYSFSEKGYDVNAIAIGDYAEENKLIVSEELVSFMNQLVDFINKNNF